uniref:anillin, actin binding protein 2 isoform X8 n=1 Tax=Monopterus albus TaxID=43700 RepID=UPI0009B4266A|nr:anillin-like isoform X8 [Monopterus albus]
MEAGEESGNANLKRPRAPLSDSEDNIPSASEVNDGQKRRRLEAPGQENHSPTQSNSVHPAEQGKKPDTPMVPSVCSRVQQLTQRREEGTPLTQRRLSGSGAGGPIHNKSFMEHLLAPLWALCCKNKLHKFKLLKRLYYVGSWKTGEGEFSQRMERFKAPVFQADPTLGPASPCSWSCSNFVSGIHQKLQETTMPSSKQASRMRQEREQELSQLNFQPIRENVWMKGSSSDLALAEQVNTPPGPSPSSWVPVSRRRIVWPPMQSRDVDGDAQMKDCSLTETSTSGAVKSSVNTTDVELSHDETKTAQIIDQMFEEVLEYAGKMDETVDNEDAEDHDSGIGACSGDMESEKEKSEEKGEAKEERDENSGDELLTFPLSSILSPLSKSVEAVVTPLRLAASQESNPPSPLLTPEDTTPTPAEFLPLYSIDAYRTQRQSKLPAIQSVTPAAQMRAPEKSQVQHSVATEDKIMSLDEEAGKLQTVISQTLQALSCCTDEEHGQGSLEEAEAEKLLLVSSEKRSALLAEVARLREERNLESGEVAGEDRDYVSQQPCRGTVNITNIQLPLKVEFVCSSHSRTGRPSHYFFVLIRYGPHNIVTTPLATPDDAQNGDTISFPTSVTLKDIRSSFKIDVEVYSLSHTPSSNCSTDRATTKSRVTPRKLLNTITQRSSNSLPSGPSTLNTRRSSNFCLVGSHKITLASLGHSKFPLDKMKLEGKIRRLLGDEFQDKVPFLSPLEGNIYLRLDSESHSNVQHQGFLTMFGLISGYGVWHRRYFVLEGCSLSFWNHPNDKETKEAEGSISLSSSPNQCVRPVKRDSCARPFTFELVSTSPHQQQDNSQEALSKCWFSADTKQERLDWMEKLSQALLDFHTWNQPSATQTESRESDMSSSGNLRESML